MRQTVVIPPAGTKKKVELTGRSILVEQMNVYSGADQVPYFDMNPGTKNYPLYPGSQYPNEQGEFDFIYVWGTTESAGDELYLMSTPECVELVINREFASSSRAIAGTSFTVSSTDVAQSLSDVQLQDSEGNLPSSIVVSALNNPIIYAFNTAPDRGTDKGHILHKNVITGGSEFNGSLLEIEGIDFILNWEFASAVAGNPAVLTITPRY